MAYYEAAPRAQTSLHQSLGPIQNRPANALLMIIIITGGRCYEIQSVFCESEIKGQSAAIHSALSHTVALIRAADITDTAMPHNSQPKCGNTASRPARSSPARSLQSLASRHKQTPLDDKHAQTGFAVMHHCLVAKTACDLTSA